MLLVVHDTRSALCWGLLRPPLTCQPATLGFAAFEMAMISCHVIFIFVGKCNLRGVGDTASYPVCCNQKLSPKGSDSSLF